MVWTKINISKKPEKIATKVKNGTSPMKTAKHITLENIYDRSTCHTIHVNNAPI